MSIKVQFNKEIHVFKGSQKSFEDLKAFVISSFKNLPKNFMLFYMDSDNDKVTLSCDADIQALIEISKTTPKIMIGEDDENNQVEDLNLSKDSSDDFQHILTSADIKSEKSSTESLKPMFNCTRCTFANPLSEEIKDCLMCKSPLKQEKEDKKCQRKKICLKKPDVSPQQKCKQLGKKHSMCKKEKKDLIETNSSEEVKIDDENLENNLQQKPRNHHSKPMHMLRERRKEMVKNMVQEEIQKQIPIIIEQVKSQLQQPEKQEEKKKKNGAFDFTSFYPAQNKVIHRGIICDGCEKIHIEGIRYKCSVCPDLDFCETCEEQLEHNHPFLKIREPHLAPKAIFVAIDEDVSQFCKKTMQQFPETTEVIQQHQQRPQVETHVFEEMIKETKVDKICKRHHKVCKPKKSKKKEELVEPQVEKEVQEQVEKQESPQVNYAIQRCAQNISEVLGGIPSDYFDVVEMYKQKKTDDIIRIILEERAVIDRLTAQNLVRSVEETTTRPKEQEKFTNNKVVYSEAICNKARLIAEILGEQFDDLCKKVSEFPDLSTEDIIENIFAEKDCQKNKERLTTPQGETEKEVQEPQQKKLKKEYPSSVQEKANQIIEILGGEAKDFYGIVDSFVLNDVNDIIEMYLNDPSLIEKHSSYI